MDYQLSPEELADLTARLTRGEPLPDHYQRLIFRQPKEYELVYAGKEPKSTILSGTQATPFQTVRRFGVQENDWVNKLIFGDNLPILKTLLDKKEKGLLKNADGTDGFRCVYIDPPFATKREFEGDKGQRAYRDKVAGAEFVEFLRKRLVFIREVLADDGVVCVHLDDKKVHYAKIVLDEIFGEENFVNEIIWSYGSASGGRAGGNKLVKNHETILVYTKNPGSQVYNKIYLPYSDKYIRDWFRFDDNDGLGLYRKRWRRDKAGKSYVEKQHLNQSPGMPAATVWSDIQQLYADPRAYKADQAQHTEMTGYPTQKPEALLSRIFTIYSNPGDLVADFFVGSGTTAVVADKMGRRWVAADCGKLAIYNAETRLLSLSEGKGKERKSVDHHPFELVNSGLYDNELIERLPFQQFKEFSLQLFGCRPEDFKLGGIKMAGRRKGAPVHFFPFEELDQEIVMDEGYIESLHKRLKGKVDGAVYVVAPAGRCDPALLQDVIQPNGIRYFILRVPFSLIEAMDNRRFQLPEQPISADEVNAALESVGFGFMELPDLAARYRVEGADEDERLVVTIDSFLRGGLEPEDLDKLPERGRTDLASVLIDEDYDRDDQAFLVSKSLFGAELRSEEDGEVRYGFSLSAASLGERFAVLYIDTHGNEYLEVLELAKLRQAERVVELAQRPEQDEEAER